MNEQAQQFLMWHMVSSGLLFGIFLILFLLVVALSPVFYKKEKKETGSGACTCVVGMCMSSVFIAIIGSNLDWLKIWIFPNLYLLEYAESLVK